jgi:hypothetical protein
MCGTKVRHMILALIVIEAVNCTCKIFHYVHTSRRVTFDTGGKLYVIGVYLGMLMAIIATFISLNLYMLLSATIAPDSSIYSFQLVSQMSHIVRESYQLIVTVISVVAWSLFYICV